MWRDLLFYKMTRKGSSVGGVWLMLLTMDYSDGKVSSAAEVCQPLLDGVTTVFESVSSKRYAVVLSLEDTRWCTNIVDGRSKTVIFGAKGTQSFVPMFAGGGFDIGGKIETRRKRWQKWICLNSDAKKHYHSVGRLSVPLLQVSLKL